MMEVGLCAVAALAKKVMIVMEVVVKSLVKEKSSVMKFC